MISEIQDRPQYCIDEVEELESRAKDFLDTLDETVDYAVAKAKNKDDLTAAFEYLSELTYTVLLAMQDDLSHLKKSINT